MGRTPKPGDTRLRVVAIRPEAHQFLLERAESERRNYSATLNEELNFLRSWGLTTMRLPRLMAAAVATHATLLQYVQTLVMSVAVGLPPAPSTPGPKSGDLHRTSVNITGPNDAFVLSHATREGLDYSLMLNRLLDFARCFWLPSNLFAALQQHAEKGNPPTTVRDFVVTLIQDAAAKLPDPPATPTKTAKGK